MLWQQMRSAGDAGNSAQQRDQPELVPIEARKSLRILSANITDWGTAVAVWLATNPADVVVGMEHHMVNTDNIAATT